jgi:hypothetical protein
MDSHLERLRSELEDATQGLTETAMAQAPAGKWTSAQILEHLYLTYKNTNKGIAKCLEKGAPLATQSTMKHRLKTFVVVGIGYFPVGAKAPERVLPRGMGSEEVHAAIFAELRSMDSSLNDCERRFGARTRIMDHPILGPLTTDQWRKFHWIHGRHHARQIRERAKL